MAEMTDDVHPRVVEVISQAVELEANNDTAFAEQILTALVEEFPKVAIAHGYLAWILSRRGQNREAIEHGRVAVQLSPKSERVSLLFFRVLWGASERNQALNEMKRFVAIGHSDEYSRMLDEWKSIEGQ